MMKMWLSDGLSLKKALLSLLLSSGPTTLTLNNESHTYKA